MMVSARVRRRDKTGVMARRRFQHVTGEETGRLSGLESDIQHLRVPMLHALMSSGNYGDWNKRGDNRLLLVIPCVDIGEGSLARLEAIPFTRHRREIMSQA